jgi:hypothetical protein
VNVTLVPGQIVVADAETDTDGTGIGITFIVMLPLVAVTGLAHTAVEVITTLITSLSARVGGVNVGLLVPAGFPFILH